MVRVIIACHGELAQALCAAATLILGQHDGVFALGLGAGEAPLDYAERLVRCAEGAEADHGVLVLTDLLGGTPHQVAWRMGRSGRLGPRWAVVTGANLGMLLEAILQRDAYAVPRELAQAVAKAGYAQVTGPEESPPVGG